MNDHVSVEESVPRKARREAEIKQLCGRSLPMSKKAYDENKDGVVYVTLCQCVTYIHRDRWPHLSASPFIYLVIYLSILKYQADQKHG